MSLATGIELEADAIGVDGLLGLLQVRQFGDYELIDEISRGGMGVVYRARQISLNREVAVKMILSGELADEMALRMFRTEARAAANLYHPHIVPVYEIGEFEMQHYFSMYYVPGGKNIAHWAAERRTDFRAIATAMAKVAHAVAHAHERGVLHRDLKPSNILWSPIGEPMVTDFGLARIIDDAEKQITRTALMAGSPSYMAPEQTLGSIEEITTATDVYGLGAVLYDLLAGRPPFVGRTILETAQMVTEASPPSLQTVPKDLRRICMKCLSKKPQDRYATALKLAEDLERFVRGEPVHALPLTPGEHVIRWARRKPALAGMICLVFLTFTLGFAGVFWQWREAEHARTHQADSLNRLRWQRIDRWINEGETARGLAYLAREIRHQPDNWRAVMYAMSIIEQNAFPVLYGPEIIPKESLVIPAKISKNGHWLAGGGRDNVVRVWKVVDGREMAAHPQASPITALAADTGLFVASEDGSLQHYPEPTSQAITLARSGASAVRHLSVSTDGSRLLARSLDRVEIWDRSALTNAPVTLTLNGGVKGAVLNASGKTALLWNDKKAVVMAVNSTSILIQMEARRTFREGAVVGEGTRAALLDGTQQARIWDFASHETFETPFDPNIDLRSLTFNAIGDRITLLGNGTDLVIYDVRSGIPVSPRMPHHYMTTHLHASHDGQRVFSYGDDDQVCMWDTTSGHSLAVPISRGRVIHGAFLDLANEGNRVLIHDKVTRQGPDALSVWGWTSRSLPRMHLPPHETGISLSRLSPNSRLGCLGLIDLDKNHYCYVFEIDTGRVLLKQPCNGHLYVTLLSPDHQRCYGLTANGWLHGWEIETGEALWPPSQQPGLIRPATISPDGQTIIAGHNDGHIRVYNTSTGQMIQSLEHPGEVKALHFAPGSNSRFVSTSTDKEAHIWNLDTGERTQTFRGHSHTIISAAWSPDAKQVATASYDYTVRVWDVATGAMVGNPMSHLAWLSHVTFSPDGRYIASACRDGTARLWHASTALPASPPLHQGHTVETVKFTHDSACFLVRDLSGFRFWSTDRAEPVTVHFKQPCPHSIGMDSESYRAIMNSDGTLVFLGYSSPQSAAWSISHPREPAPAWFPDWLESFAMVTLDNEGAATQSPRRPLSEILDKIRDSDPDDPYAKWVRQILGE